MRVERVYVVMRSLEKGHRNADIDQVNPEHVGSETAEFSWDDLSKVPFGGNQQQPSENIIAKAEKYKGLIDSLPTDDETIQTKREEEAKQQVQDVFQKMDHIRTFGKNTRNEKRPSTQEFSKTQEANEDSATYQELSDISTTF